MSSTKQKVRLAGACAALATLALAISCSGFFVNPTLTGVSVGPSGVVLTLGGSAAPTFSMTATGTYSDGSQKTLTSGVVWSSDTPTVATVGQSTGLVSGIAPGSANITASSGGCSACSGSTAVKVALGSVTSITVSPASQSVTIGGSPAIFTASASGVDVTSTSTWTLKDPSGVDQTANFTLTYVAGSGEAILPTSSATPQTYTVTATYQSTTTVKGNASLTVN
jgi:trimeric autotransporter adhesin